MRFALAIATFTGHSGAGWVKMMGLKELFTIRMGYFHPYSQYSSIPSFHSDGINRLPLINLYFRKVVGFPRRLIGAYS